MSYDPNQPQQPPYGQQPQWGQQPYGQPGQPEQPPTQYAQPQYGVPPLPGYVQPQPQPKRSLRWLWITLGIVGGVLVLGCVGCALVLAGVINFAGQVAAPAVTATQYYQAIENQQYDTAYTYLDTSGATVQGQTVTQQAFTQGATFLDQTKGRVTTFKIGNVSVNNNTDATVVVTVTRSSGSYDVTLQLKKEGSDWKIVKVDNI